MRKIWICLIFPNKSRIDAWRRFIFPSHRILWSFFTFLVAIKYNKDYIFSTLNCYTTDFHTRFSNLGADFITNSLQVSLTSCPTCTLITFSHSWSVHWMHFVFHTTEQRSFYNLLRRETFAGLYVSKNNRHTPTQSFTLILCVWMYEIYIHIYI